MKRLVLFFVLAGLLFKPADGQTEKVSNSGCYEVWIKQGDEMITPKGILYEIRDSAICVVYNIYQPEIILYRYNELEKIKIRKQHNIRKGLITGSVAGAVIGIITANSIPGGLSFMTIPFSAAAGLFTAIPGAGIGALTGSIKDNIPVKRDYENFNKYKGSLQDYSYLQEADDRYKAFRHKSYAGFGVGISFAADEFADAVPADGYTGMNKTGFSSETKAGYRFNEFLELNLTLNEDSYSVRESNGEMSWTFDAFILSPGITIPLSPKFRLGVEPGIGFAGTTLSDADEFLMNGSGLGLRLNGFAVFDYAKRWSASGNISTMYSNQKFEEGGTGKAKSLDLKLGLVYKFGRKSL